MNCLVTEVVDGVKKCRYCKEDYSFNYDGLCKKIYLDYCDDKEVEILDLARRPLLSEYEFALLRFRDGWGCKKCPENKI